MRQKNDKFRRRMKTGLTIAGVIIALLIGLMAFLKITRKPDEAFELKESKSISEMKNTLRDIDDADAELNDFYPHRAEWHEYEDGTIEYQGKRYRRNTYVKAVLALGIDTHDDLRKVKPYGECDRADAIFLMAEDTSKNHSRILILPRDSMTNVEYHDENGNPTGVELGFLDTAFAMLPDPEESSELEMNAVSKLLCNLQINEYITFNLNVVNDVTDVLDGITVMVPNTELVKMNPDWKLGRIITLDADDAERFIRYRDLEKFGSSVIRIDQHKEFVLGFYEATKKKAKENKDIIQEIYDAACANMITSMTKSELLNLGATELNVTLNENDIIYLPGEIQEYDYTQYYVDYEETIPIILDLFYREIS